MARKSNLLDKPLSALAQGAARLAQMERGLKEGHFRETRNLAPAEEQRNSNLSPDEAWSRRFLNLGIGPQPELAPIRIELGASAVPLSTTRGPAQPELKVAVAPAAPAMQPVATKPDKGPIGLAIGKPIKRPLFSRLFGR